jgi:pyruvate dehydrogenase E2 component (dihydrolipoamide acetyltransferase)
MARVIHLTELGENVKDGDIVRVLVAPGSTVAAEQPLLELETGKATLEFPSPEAGTVAELHVKEGDKIKVGDRILTFAEAGVAPGAPQPAAPAAPVSPAVPKSAPALPVVAGPPSFAPSLREAAPKSPAPPTGAKPVWVAAAPSVRRFAREIGVEIDQVKGTGEKGRITGEDVKRFARQINTGRATPTHCSLHALPLPDFTKWGAVQKEAMSNVRTATAEHLSRCWSTIPHVTQFDKADVTALEALRKRLSPRVETAGGKLTLTAILLKIVAAALKVHPKFAASLDMARREIFYKKYIHIGVAVDSERGLLVPVLRDVDRKNILQIAVELTALSQRSRSGKLGLEEMQGGTFTLTNLGGIGGGFFTPIINGPEVAILGVGRSILEPACGAKDGLCAPRMMLPLSLSYDHRLIDGADGVRFLRWIVEAIQEPMLISLEG